MSTREVRTKNGKKRISQEVKMEIVREYYLEGQHNQSALARKITPSMTENGNPKDNAMAERINNTVKNELLHGKTYASIRQVSKAVRDSVAFYNSERPHSSLDWHTPDEAHGMCGDMKRHWHSWREETNQSSGSGPE